MSIPKEYDFNYYAGDSYQLVLYPKNEDGTQYSLENHIGLFTVALDRGDPLTNAFSASVQISASPSRVIVEISPTLGTLLSGASYVYDIEITDLDAPQEIYTFVTGNINVQQQITRRSLQQYQNPGALSVTDEADVIINGGVPTSVFYSIFDGGTP
jgi:hypothetical protein